jgi:hypothetical protein
LENNPNHWHNRLDNLKKENFKFDAEKFLNESKKIGTKDTYMIGQSKNKDGQQSSIVCREDGIIDIFASSNVGIRLNPNLETISFHSPTVHFFTQEINFNTRIGDGMRWNKFPIILSPVLPPGAGTISPTNTLAFDAQRLMTKLLSTFGGR